MEEAKQDKESFLLSVYARCFDSKHHYDNLSWTIGGILLVFVGAILAYIPQIKASIYFSLILKRLPLVFFAWVLIYLWFRIYERNRFYAEVANETIREIERIFKIKGIGTEFMKATLSKNLTLKNVDEVGGKLGEPLEVKLKENSMHRLIPKFLIAIAVLVLLSCFIP
ncbi:MAG: hypothetical protein ACE5KJ_04040 [Candidatus Zixiibacteriota bacterium]